jgi:hypothetical protein
VENPEIYRKNFGFALWNAGYDGAMDYAYQYKTGSSIWNDFDNSNTRDLVFAYPTSSGVIDTIQWEGWREGVDDTRFVASAMKHGASADSVRSIITDSQSKGDSMATLRNKVINLIPVSQTPIPTPTPAPTVSPTPGPTSLPTSSQSVEMGIYSNGIWNLDNNGDWIFSGTDKTVHFGTTGDIPVSNDWNGDGISDIGVFRPSNGNWYLETTKTGTVNSVYHLGTQGSIPVTAKWS